MDFVANPILLYILHFKLFLVLVGASLYFTVSVCPTFIPLYLFNLKEKNCQTLDKHGKHGKLKSTVLLIAFFFLLIIVLYP